MSGSGRRCRRCPARDAPVARRAGPRRHRPHRRTGPPALRRPARQPSPGPGRALAAQLQRGLLHDRLGRARGQRGGGRRAARRPTRRCCTTAPARSTAPAPRQRPGQSDRGRATCCAGWSRPRQEPIAGGRHKVFGRADLHDHPAPRRRSPRTCPGRSGVALRHRAAPPALRRRRDRRGRTTRSWWLVRRRLGQPRHRHRRVQRRRLVRPHRRARCRCCWSARTTASGISVPSPRRLGRRGAGLAARAALLRRRRLRPGRHLRRGRATPSPRSASSAGPAVLHLSMVRLMGHAGADAEIGLPRRPTRSPPTSPATRWSATARLLVEAGLLTPAEVHRPLRRGRLAGPQGRRGGPRRAEAGVGAPRWSRRWRRAGRCASPAPSPRRPTAPPVPARPPGSRRSAAGCPSTPARSPWRRPSTRRSPTRCSSIPAMLVFGEDVAAQGRRVRGDQGPAGPLRAGPGLRHAARRDRRSSGLALGAGLAGLLPVPEIQYLAYLHNAEDQLRGEAATLSVLLAGALPQSDGRAGRRARLPGGLRRALPQRQRGRGAARRSRAGPRRAGAGRRTPRRCCAPAWPPPRSTAASASSSSRSRSTTPATCTAGRRRVARAVRRARRLGRRARADRPRADLPVGSAEDLTIVTFGNGVRMSLRVGRPAGRGGDRRAGSSTCAGWPRCRWPTWSARPRRPAGSWSSTRPAARGGVGEGVLAALVDARFRGRGAADRVGRLAYPARTRPRTRSGRRGADHTGCHALLAPGNFRPHSVRHLRPGSRDCVDYALCTAC